MKSIYKTTSDLSKKHKATQEKGGPLITPTAGSQQLWASAAGGAQARDLGVLHAARCSIPFSLWGGDSSGCEAPDARLLYSRPVSSGP